MTADLRFFRDMTLIRRAEQRLAVLFSEGRIPGFVHLGLGQEAVPVGVCSALGSGDTVASTHRGHGHALAKGMSLDGFFAEILGRETGVCAGRAGSLHVADMSVGMLGANGIVGGGLSIALGSALAHQIKGTGHVAVAFFGDGAMAEGVLHECLNLAALWKLPLLLVCENNGWSEFSASDELFRARLQDIAGAFGVSWESVDGCEVREVAAAAERAVAGARSGTGPRVLECITHRWDGHYAGDPQKYRTGGDRKAAREFDPLPREAARLAQSGTGNDALHEVEAGIDRLIEAAVQQALSAPHPDAGTVLRDVFAMSSRFRS